MYKILFPFLGFNSTLVQLKEDFGVEQNRRGQKFQFYLSSIKSALSLLPPPCFPRFNSTLVQLKEPRIQRLTPQ